MGTERRKPGDARFDWPQRWRDADPAAPEGREADIAAAFARAADGVRPATEIDRQRAWARLRAVVHPVRQVRAWVPALAAGVVAVLAVAAFFTAERPVESGLRQVVLRPAVASGVDTENAVLGGDVAAGTPLRTAANGIATVDIGAVGVLLLQRETHVATRPLAGDVVRVRVVQGEIVARLQHSSPLGLVVEAGDLEVKVTGTVFGVRSGSEGTLVRVWRGAVEVRDAGRLVRVAEGQRYLKGELGPLVASDRLEPRVASLIGWEGGPAPAPVDEAKGTPVPAPTPAVVTVAPTPDIPAAVSAAAEPVPVVVRQGSISRRAPVAAVADVSEPESPASRERRLTELARGGSPEAATALFALAALRYDVTGDRAGAIRAWSEYVARFPEGPLVGDARAQLFEALLAEGSVDAAVVQGREAWTRASGAERGRLALRLAETLHRRQSRPDVAIPMYEQLVADGGPEADRAAYLVIDALQRAGRTADAHAALDRYLAIFPTGAYVRDVAAERQRWSGSAPRQP